MILEDDNIWYCFTLFICGGPCHISIFKQRFGDIIFLWEQFIQLLNKIGKEWKRKEKKKVIVILMYLINIVNIKIPSLNFFSETT